jgi:hypothetical protein
VIANQLRIHQFIAEKQRESHNNLLENISENELMVVMDFKENIRLGEGPVELGRDFYTKQQCSVLGFAVVFCDQVSKQPIIEYIDFFSDILSHDALFASSCLRVVLKKYLENNNNMGQSKITKVHFWNDTGRHFQCAELAHFLLNKVSFEFGVQVTWNFFGEHHGKNIVDGHFSILSQWIKDLAKFNFLDSMETLIRLLKDRVEVSQMVSSNQGTNIFFEVYERVEREKKINILNIKKFTDNFFYESVFSNNRFLIKAKIFTSSEHFTENLEIRSKTIEDKRKTKRGSDFTENKDSGKNFLGQTNGEEPVFGRIVQKRMGRQQVNPEILFLLGCPRNQVK